MAKSKKTTKTSRKTATKKKAASPKKRATVKKTVKKKSTKKMPAKKTDAKKKVTTAQRGSAASRAAGKNANAATMDRRADQRDERREPPDRRAQDEPIKVEHRQLQRREKVNRRRQIDPTTCERDYTDEEVEFMQALDAYKRKSNRMFPTCSEILEVIRDIGYSKQPVSTPQTASPDFAPPNELDEAADESLATLA